MAKICSPGSEDWARFTDWLEEDLGRARDWTVIAKTFDAGRPFVSGFKETSAIFSYLIDPKEVPMEEVFSDAYWDFRADFEALVDRLSPDSSGDTYVDSLREGKRHPLVQFRNRIGDYPAVWRVWPALEDYFNLRRSPSGDLVDPYTGAKVVDMPQDANNEPLRIRTDYLREYLAARRMVLIRQHDHTRSWKEPIAELGEVVVFGDPQRTQWGCYALNIVNHSRDRVYFSRLVAKDFIPAYESAGRIGGRRGQPGSTDCPEFIVGQELSGQLETRRPEEHALGPPVYFDPKVLKRYYDEPSRYSVGFWAPGLGGVSGLNWSLALGRNDEGMIIAWLGDFLKQGVPMEEIHHWRTHNAVPHGRMAEDFWNAQMMCTPPGQPSLESRLRDTRHHLQKGVQQRGKSIFRAYEGPDKHAEKTLREPLYDEHPELHEAIRLLSIVFVEYLDAEHFKGSLTLARRTAARGEALGSIALLGNWLTDVLGVATVVAERVTPALQRLQAVRSNISGSHRFSDTSYQKAITKLNLKPGASAREVYRAVAEPLAEALEELCIELGLRDEIWWLKRSD